MKISKWLMVHGSRLMVIVAVMVSVAANARKIGFNGDIWYDYRDESFDVDGKGSLADPIVITTPEQLAQLAYLVNERDYTFAGKVVVLGADIDLSGSAYGDDPVQWIPIGKDASHCFQGVFIGTNPNQDGWKQTTHKISNMYIDAQTETPMVEPEDKGYYYKFGLFGYCSGFIGYMRLDGVDISVKHKFYINPIDVYVGALCGQQTGTVVTAVDQGEKSFQAPVGIYAVSVSNARLVAEKINFTGGIVGMSESYGVCHTTFAGTIDANEYEGGNIGGICGSTSGSLATLSDCTAQVAITGGYTVGGIVGELRSGTRIEACSSSGSLSNVFAGGGICGQQNSSAPILACTSSASISGKEYAGGIVGTSKDSGSSGLTSKVSCCVFTGHVNGADTKYGAGGIYGYLRWKDNAYIDHCLFLGTIINTSKADRSGLILGSNSDPMTVITNCYIDKSICGPGKVAGSLESHFTVKSLFTQQLTTGDQSDTPLLDVDPAEGYGMLLQAGFYPRAYSNNVWPGLEQFQANGCSEACRILFNKDNMLPDNTVSLAESWLCSVPVVIQKGDCAMDFVSTAETKRATASVTLSDKSRVRLTSDCIIPEAPCIEVDEATIIAKSVGKCVLNLSSTAEMDATFSRPRRVQGHRDFPLNVVYGEVWDGSIATACAGGTGTAEDPYIIKNGAQLAYAVLNNQQGEFYEQICDITLFENRHSEPRPTNKFDNIWFNNWPETTATWQASYDGKGHFVKGGYIFYEGLGLFGNIDTNGSVANLGIVDTHVTLNAGLFAGRMDGTITNCIAQGTVGRSHGDDDYYKAFSGGICSLVGPTNADALIEDCIAAVYTIEWSFADFTPFVSLSDDNHGKVSNCLTVEPMTHQDKDFNNSGITASGKSYIKDCYWLKGYEEANTGQTLDEIGNALSSRDLWEWTPGYFPTLKTFAKSDMAKLLMLPFRTDIDYVYDYATESSDNYLFGFGRQIPFEPGAAKWTSTDGHNYHMESDADIGIVVPVSASFDPYDYRPDTDARTLGGLHFMIGKLGTARHYIPMRPRKGAVNPGITFVDDNARQACLAAFNTDDDPEHLSLAELKAVTNEQTLTAFQTSTGRMIKQFPEFRFFKSVTELTSQLNKMNSLESVSLPYALQTIGAEAFKNCPNLKTVTLPSRVTAVRGGAFYGSSVQDIAVDPLNETFTSRDGVLFTKKNVLTAYPNGRTGTEATITGTVRRIASGAFYKLTYLRELYFETNDYTTVTELTDGALVTDDGSQMDVYVSDATTDHTLLTEYLEDESWQPYVTAGRLHQYFPLRVPDGVTTVFDGKTRYVGTFYIGFPTQLPDELIPCVVNAIDEDNYKAYYYEKSRLVPAIQPVIVLADQPGLYRLTPIEGEVERWPVYRNWLVGVERDPMPVNQGTSAQGSIMTPQMNDQGQFSFLFEKGKEIAPYHCYLGYNTIGKSPAVAANAHYDMVYSLVNSGTVTVDDMTFAVNSLLPDNSAYSVLTKYEGVGGQVTVPGTISAKLNGVWKSASVRQIAPGAFSYAKGLVMGIDMSALDDLEPLSSDRSLPDAPLGGIDKRTIIYLPQAKATPALNTVVGKECVELQLTDSVDFCPPYHFHADKVGYDREFILADNGDGTWSDKAYTVCLPFDIDLSDRSADLTLWTLAYIKNGKEMVFTKTVPYIEAGMPYMIVMHQGEMKLQTSDVMLTGTPAEGVRVYDWDNKEQPLGWWRGTLAKIESADAAAVMAYALQSVGDFRRIRPDTPWAWWGAFRSMYCPDELPGTNKFTINRGSFGGLGGNAPDIFFTGDADIPDDGTGIRTMDNGQWIMDNCWYAPDGRKLSGKPTHPGVYLYNGKKIIIK